MLSRRTRAIVVVYVAMSVVQVVAVGSGQDLLADIAQVLLMPVLVAALVSERAAPRSRLVRLTLLALAFSWLGDSAPRLMSGDAAFLAMVGFFLIAQVCYIAAFRPYAADSILQRSRGRLAAYAFVTLAIIAICLPAAGVLAPAVVVYGLCLGTMAVLATGVNALAWVGGSFFLVSDGLIAIDAFSELDLPAHDVSVMATYVVAQLLLVLGVIARDARADPEHTRASSGRGSSAAPDLRRTTPPPATPAP